MKRLLPSFVTLFAWVGPLLLGVLPTPSFAAEFTPTRTALLRAVDLDVNETQEVRLADGSVTTIKLVQLEETRDPMREAVREARVKVEVNGQSLILTSATYHLPVKFGGVQIDCPITQGHITNSSEGNAWGLVKDARLRLWPAGSPWIEPGTFLYPLKQRWFASHTQMANEPSFVDGGEAPSNKRIYYHYGLDSGGAEGMVDVVAATAGRVISSGTERLPGYEDSPVKPRYDVVYLLDERGWYYRYSHLQTIDPALKPGAQVNIGQKVGVLGKEGGSGGWSHLHFDITSRQPSGLWGIQEGYAFLWQTYQRQYTPKIVAVARPHHFVYAGDKVILDGSKSWSASGQITRYDWTFTDGTTASGATVERSYTQSGEYSEVLKITDARGQVDYDFAVVLVIDKSAPNQLPPTIHPAYAPTANVRPGDPLTFKVRSFLTTVGNETWDFGDGSEKVTVKSDGNVDQHAKDGYAVTQHRFAQPGHYLVRVERTNEHGQRAIAHLHVPVEEGKGLSQDSGPFSAPGASEHAARLQTDQLRAVIVDNEAFGTNHRAGYNGVAELTLGPDAPNLFAPQYAGLNFEHIFSGDAASFSWNIFEPRRAPLQVLPRSPTSVELIQDRTKHWPLRSQLTYEINGDAIDLKYCGSPLANVWAKHGYIGVFFASYLQKPEELSLQFIGRSRAGRGEAKPRWVKHLPPKHGVAAYHRSAESTWDPPFDDGFNIELAKNTSDFEYVYPFYFGRSGDNVFVMMFERPHDGGELRFAQSPSGGGAGNPAWDFFWLQRDYKVGREFCFRARAVLRPFTNAEEVVALYEQWSGEKVVRPESKPPAE